MKYAGLIIVAFLALVTIHAADGQTINGVTSGASFAPGETAPGSIATIFGANLSTGTASATTVPLPTTLASTTVSVNGLPAPLYFVSPTQINFQVPNNALEGTYVTAYLTGIGPVDNPVPAGLTTPPSPPARATLPYSATIGGGARM